MVFAWETTHPISDEMPGATYKGAKDRYDTGQNAPVTTGRDDVITKTGTIPAMCMVCILGSLCILSLPVHAFTSNSLDITVDKNGDAVANFQFTLEGIVENAIPLSMLEGELVKGLATSSDPPVILSFDKSGARILLKNFAVKNDVPTGTEYLTAPMDFHRAEIALKNSALSSVVSADFSPQRMVVTFPDGYSREFMDFSGLPALRHTIIDPTKPALATSEPLSGTISVNSSPLHARVFIDTAYAGDAPSTFSGITPGQHQISLEMDGYVPYTGTVTVTAGNTTTVNAVLSYVPPLTPKKSSMPGFGWVCAGIAVVGCGIVFWRRR